MTTIRAAWTHARDRLAPTSASPSLDAQILLTDVVGAHDRAWLFAHADDLLPPDALARYSVLIDRRAAGEPVAYIRGFKSWYARDIIVTPDVLIPRPETELLLEAALDAARTDAAHRIADVCTGSGALAVVLAAHLPDAAVLATDLSEAALAVARRNAAASNVTVDFRHGDLLAPLEGERVDLLVSNPPYIARDILATLDVRHHEPSLALDGGPDGLDLVRRLLTGAPAHLNPGATVLVEIGADQGENTLALASEHLAPAHAEIVKDYAGHDRFLRALLPG